MPRTCLPRRSTSPALGSSNPAMTRRVVVLPQPDGTSKAKNSPSSMMRSTSSTARTTCCERTSTNSLTRWRISTAGIGGMSRSDSIRWRPSSPPAPTTRRRRRRRTGAGLRPGARRSPAYEDPDLVPSVVEESFALTRLGGEEQALLRLLAWVDPGVVPQLGVDQALVERGLVRGAVGGVVRDVRAHLRIEDVVDEHLGQRLVRRALGDGQAVDPEVRAFGWDD